MSNKPFYEHTVNLVTGDSLDLSQRLWDAVLVVNIASKCGFTPQLGSLEDLYQLYRDAGLLIIGFPSNDFMGQEPLADEEIDKFCVESYGITFPIAVKDHVKGSNKQPIYKLLTEESPARFSGDPGWNFVKFLVDGEGQVVGRYSSMTRPGSKKITRKIEELLNPAEAITGTR